MGGNKECAGASIMETLRNTHSETEGNTQSWTTVRWTNINRPWILRDVSKDHRETIQRVPESLAFIK